MDYLSLKAAVSEAQSVLSGARVTDAWQAGPGEVVLLLRRKPAMVLSIDPARPGLFILESEQLPQRAPTPFTDLLRARVKGTTLESIELLEPGERIAILSFAAVWPAKKGTPLEMALEIMGRRSNLMLLEEGRILQPLRAVSRERSPARPVLAGEPYRVPPPLPGIPLESVTVDELPPYLSQEDAGSLHGLVRGLSSYSLLQIYNKVVQGMQEGDHETALNGVSLARVIGEMIASCTGEQGFLHRSGPKIYLSPFEPALFGESDTVWQFTPFSGAAAAWREVHSPKSPETSDETTQLERRLQERLERINSAIQHMDAEEKRCLAHDDVRVMAEALLIHASAIQAGSESVTLPDPYDSGIEIIIPLDRTRSPQENAGDLFNQARRLKRGMEEVRSRRGRLEKELKEAQTSLEALEEGNPEPARRLLGETTGRAAVKSKTRQASYSGPGRRYTLDGFTILVGKSSTDNEKVTFKAAGPNDLWLHARDYPGSHVVILTEKRSVPDKVLYEAAALAAAGSGAKNDTAPEIMVTERKWVRKLKGGKPGQVTVERFRTIRPRM